LDDSQRDDTNDKIRLLLKNSNDLNSFLSARIPILELYLRFHQEADHLTNLFNNLEQTLKTQKRSDDFHYIDTVWAKIQSQFTILKNIAKLFTAEKAKVCCLLIEDCWLAACFDSRLDWKLLFFAAHTPTRLSFLVFREVFGEIGKKRGGKI
jgi:hypothetical protein